MKTTAEKYADLRAGLRALGSVAVAFSGGVDSTFLLWVAHDVLGDAAAAITVDAPACPRREMAEAADFCRRYGIRQRLIPVDQMAIPGFADNPPDRCYHCKKVIFTHITKAAREMGITAVADGSNVDDTGDYRPGMAAIRELGIVSPLLAAGLTKAEIRALSKERGLPGWDRPSAACLASRFAYGQRITVGGLSRVEAAEDMLHGMGFDRVRVRVHGDLARIEVDPALFPRLLEGDGAARIARTLSDLGFAYVTLDLRGYRTGSMNEVLSRPGDSPDGGADGKE